MISPLQQQSAKTAPVKRAGARKGLSSRIPIICREIRLPGRKKPPSEYGTKACFRGTTQIVRQEPPDRSDSLNAGETQRLSPPGSGRAPPPSAWGLAPSAPSLKGRPAGHSRHGRSAYAFIIKPGTPDVNTAIPPNPHRQERHLYGRPRGRCPRAPAKGTRPLGFPSFFWGVGTGACARPLPRWYFLPRCCSLRGRSPAYPFFRKEKIQPHVRRRQYDAESLKRVLLRSCFLQGAMLCHARNPPAIRFAPGPPPFNKGGKGFLRLTESVQTLCAAGTTLHAGGSFFLYEKSVLRESDSLRGRKKEVSADLTPTLSAL